MPFYFRKSVSVGPFRFNLSGSGVGMSVGIPGFRVGSGPRGNYVRVGTGCVSYRQTIPREAPRPALAPAGSAVAMAEIESVSTAEIVDSSSDELLAEIRAKRGKMALTPVAVVLTVTAFVYGMSANSLVATLALVAGIPAILAARYRDRIVKTAVILYDLEPAVEQAFSRFTEWADALAASRKTWHIAASGHVHDRKYHAGASSLVRRALTPVRNAQPPHIVTNVPVLGIGAGVQTLYFLPDRLLVYDGSGVGAVSYKSLNIAASSQRFIEEEGVPSDATVVGHTWRYVNKNGTADRRFNHNPQLPVCLYDELHLWTGSELNEIVQISRPGIGAGFAAAVRHLAATTP